MNLNPPNSGQLKKLERERGPAHQWLPIMLKAMTEFQVATELHVYTNSVRYWKGKLSQGLIRVDGRWEHPQREEQAS